MPQLTNAEEIKQIYLPSTEDQAEADKAWVKMDISPFKTSDITIADDTMNKGEIGIAMLAIRIKDWNFTSDGTPEGAKVPINVETVGLLDIDDFSFLQGEIKAGKTLTDEEKKVSSNLSSPTETTTTIPVTSR